MERFLSQPIDRANVAETSKDMSWERYAKRVVELV
jgi:hypothetical protein